MERFVLRIRDWKPLAIVKKKSLHKRLHCVHVDKRNTLTSKSNSDVMFRNSVNLVSLLCFGTIKKPNSRQMVHNSYNFININNIFDTSSDGSVMKKKQFFQSFLFSKVVKATFGTLIRKISLISKDLALNKDLKN